MDPSTDAATLTCRRLQQDAREPVPASDWRFASVDAAGNVWPSDTSCHLPGGFRPGWIYELIYTAKDPLVLGLGFAGVRDLLDFLRYADEDAAGQANPLREGSPGIEKAYGWGRSQSGRFLRGFVYEGFNVSDSGRRIFDGVFSHVAGGGRLRLNYRFAQPDRYPRQHEDHHYPSEEFPFAYARTEDPFTGEQDAVLKRPETDPRVIHTQTATEYWQRRGSLVHTDPHGNDLPEHENVRVYLLSSLQHNDAAAALEGGVPRYPLNPAAGQSGAPRPAERAGPVGDGRRRAPRQPGAAAVRRHPRQRRCIPEGVSGGAGKRLSRPSRTVLPGPGNGLRGRHHRQRTAGGGQEPGVPGPGAFGGRRRQRERGGAGAGGFSAAGNLHGLEPAARLRGHGGDRRQRPPLRRDGGSARRAGRPPSLHRGGATPPGKRIWTRSGPPPPPSRKNVCCWPKTWSVAWPPREGAGTRGAPPPCDFGSLPLQCVGVGLTHCNGKRTGPIHPFHAIKVPCRLRKACATGTLRARVQAAPTRERGGRPTKEDRRDRVRFARED